MRKNTERRKSKEMTIEGIKRIIEKSGYLLEVDVSDALQRDLWGVSSQYTYVDKTEKQVRFINILGFKPIIDQSAVLMLVECKKSTKHGWAFRTIRKKDELQSSLGIIEDIITRLDALSSFSASAFQQEDIRHKFHISNPEIKIGTLCCIPPGHPDDFHQATRQLLNGLKWLWEERKNQIFFPVIVFDGPMWEFYKEKGELKVEEIDYLQYLSVVLTKEGEFPCLIDVVKSSYFAQFLKLVNKSIEWLLGLLQGEEGNI